MKRTAAVFGSIWGGFALIFSLFLFLMIFTPETAPGSDFAPFANSVLAYFDGSAFGAAAWAIAVGAFGLGALGLIAASIVRQHHIAAGILLLVSVVGMLLVCFQSFLVGEYSLLDDFIGFFEFGQPEQIVALLLTVILTLVGFLGSLFSLVSRPMHTVPQPTAFSASAEPVPAEAEPVVSAVPAEPAVPEAAYTAAEPVAPTAPQPVEQPLDAQPAEPQEPGAGRSAE